MMSMAFLAKEEKLPAHRAGLPGNVDMITGSALLPAIPSRRDRQGGASSRLARESCSNLCKLKGKGLWNRTDTRNK